MSIHIDIDPMLKFEQTILVELLEIWRGQAKADAMPDWSAFDPVKIPTRILPHLYLIDGLDEKLPRPRWRLLGTHTTNTLGRDNTGKYFDEVYSAEDARDMSVPVLWVMEKREPARITGLTLYADMDWLPFESIYLPYSGSGGTVNRILGGVVYAFNSVE